MADENVMAEGKENHDDIDMKGGAGNGDGDDEKEMDENLNDEDVDGDGYEFIIHGDMENINIIPEHAAKAGVKSDVDGGDVDVKGEMQQQLLFRFQHQATASEHATGLDRDVEEKAFMAMKYFGINRLNYHTFCPQITKRHTPFEIDLTETAEANLIGSERPWRRTGATLDDFFNYGFNENTWKDYAAKQVALKLQAIKKLSDEEIEASASTDDHEGFLN